METSFRWKVCVYLSSRSSVIIEIYRAEISAVYSGSSSDMRVFGHVRSEYQVPMQFSAIKDTWHGISLHVETQLFIFHCLAGHAVHICIIDIMYLGLKVDEFWFISEI